MKKRSSVAFARVVTVFCVASAFTTATEIATLPRAFYGNVLFDWFICVTVLADIALAFGREKRLWMTALLVIAASLPASIFFVTDLWPNIHAAFGIVPIHSPYIQLLRAVTVLGIVGAVAINSKDGMSQFLAGEPRKGLRRASALILVTTAIFVNPYGLTYRPRLPTPLLNPGPGVYDAPVECQVSVPGSGRCRIVYSTHGGTPFRRAVVVEDSPILISKSAVVRCVAVALGFRPSDVVTQAYIVSSSIADQNETLAAERGLPERWRSVPANYAVDLRSAYGMQDMEAKDVKLISTELALALRSLPTLSIAIEPNDLFGARGIYSNPERRGRDWERPCDIQLMQGDGQVFGVRGGLRIHGNATRSPDYTAKHSLRICFRKQYGVDAVKWPLFPSHLPPVDVVVLRGSGVDSWRFMRLEDVQYVRDEFARRTHQVMGRDSPYGSFVHVFLNGLYWGIYNTVERPSASYAVRRYGGSKKDWDIIKDGEVQHGDAQAWEALLGICSEMEESNDEEQIQQLYYELTGGDVIGSRDKRLPVLLDIDAYIDYLLVNVYVASTDWPTTNFVAFRPRNQNAVGFRFSIWDCEQSLGINRTETLNGVSLLGADRGVAKPFLGLMKCNDFMQTLTERIHLHFGNGGVFYVHAEGSNQENSFMPNEPLVRYGALANEIEEAIILEAVRWGNQSRAEPIDCVTNWKTAKQQLVDGLLVRRSARMIEEFREAGLFKND